MSKFPRCPMLSFNNYSFCISWKMGKDGNWKTYYRKFHLTHGKYNILHGQYISNLYFDEDLDLNNQDIYFMIYALPIEVEYLEIENILDNNDLDKLSFYNIFILKKEEWKKRSSDLNYAKQCYVRLINEDDNFLQLNVYKGISTHTRNEKKYGVTLPCFRIKLNSLKMLK